MEYAVHAVCTNSGIMLSSTMRIPMPPPHPQQRAGPGAQRVCLLPMRLPSMQGKTGACMERNPRCNELADVLPAARRCSSCMASDSG